MAAGILLSVVQFVYSFRVRMAQHDWESKGFRLFVKSQKVYYSFCKSSVTSVGETCMYWMLTCFAAFFFG